MYTVAWAYREAMTCRCHSSLVAEPIESWRAGGFKFRYPLDESASYLLDMINVSAWAIGDRLACSVASALATSYAEPTREAHR